MWLKSGLLWSPLFRKKQEKWRSSKALSTWPKCKEDAYIYIYVYVMRKTLPLLIVMYYIYNLHFSSLICMTFWYPKIKFLSWKANFLGSYISPLVKESTTFFTASCSIGTALSFFNKNSVWIKDIIVLLLS